MDLDAYLDAARAFDRDFRGRWEPVAPAPAAEVDPGRLAAAWTEYTGRLQDNYPFFHPRYAGQMLKPPHPLAVAGYLAAMTINPNNHALDGGPATGAMEKEVVGDLAAMFGLPGETLGHLTSSGTIANLEALWVARQLAPGRAVAHSQDAHYTHARMCEVLGMESVAVPADPAGRMDLDALEPLLASGRVGTVVLTAGTTGLGAVDPIDEALALRDRHGCRLHVDAAYGGFFALLAGDEDGAKLLGPETAARLAAVGACDSVVVDPHKHGLQPYGCGAVLFRDPGVGRLYQHDSPYTYFTSEELHLGEISLECSRAGAAAGALWLTLRVLPLEAGRGLGAVVAGGLRAAKAWAELLEASDELVLYQPPELDILAFWPRPASPSCAAVDAASAALLRAAMDDPSPVYLSTLRLAADRLRRRDPSLAADVGEARVLRSVLMKPEHEGWVETLHAEVLRIVSGPVGRGGAAPGR
ncbi:MAG TPA: aminotransferase class I/II-fold pyridoxal phosphate-dependent enzyme [Actinomycetota bacterium]|nr:aminotransferase class I/II-fold pyridoxal phosphate-dependent enzyme [Actinomycetota bacterium]